MFFFFADWARRVSPTLVPRSRRRSGPTAVCRGHLPSRRKRCPDFSGAVAECAQVSPGYRLVLWLTRGTGSCTSGPFLNLADPGRRCGRCRCWPTSCTKEVFKGRRHDQWRATASGLSRTWFLRKQFRAVVRRVFVRSSGFLIRKNLLIYNPGKVVGRRFRSRSPRTCVRLFSAKWHASARGPAKRDAESSDTPAAAASRHQATRTALGLERPASSDGRRLQWLRPLPHAVARCTHVSHSFGSLSCRRSFAAGPRRTSCEL